MTGKKNGYQEIQFKYESCVVQLVQTQAQVQIVVQVHLCLAPSFHLPMCKLCH